MTRDYIPLANANAGQGTTNGVKSDWVVRENITGVELGEFNARISDEDMFRILKFARKYELAAFNTGIQFQKDLQNEKLEADIARLTQERQAILKQNEELAATVERLTR